MTSTSKPCFEKMPASLATHGIDKLGLGDTIATWLFSAAAVPIVKENNRHPAIKAWRFLISGASYWCRNEPHTKPEGVKKTMRPRAGLNARIRLRLIRFFGGSSVMTWGRPLCFKAREKMLCD